MRNSHVKPDPDLTIQLTDEQWATCVRAGGGRTKINQLSNVKTQICAPNDDDLKISEVGTVGEGAFALLFGGQSWWDQWAKIAVLRRPQEPGTPDVGPFHVRATARRYGLRFKAPGPNGEWPPDRNGNPRPKKFDPLLPPFVLIWVKPAARMAAFIGWCHGFEIYRNGDPLHWDKTQPTPCWCRDPGTLFGWERLRIWYKQWRADGSPAFEEQFPPGHEG